MVQLFWKKRKTSVRMSQGSVTAKSLVSLSLRKFKKLKMRTINRKNYLIIRNRHLRMYNKMDHQNSSKLWKKKVKRKIYLCLARRLKRRRRTSSQRTVSMKFLHHLKVVREWVGPNRRRIQSSAGSRQISSSMTHTRTRKDTQTRVEEIVISTTTITNQDQNATTANTTKDPVQWCDTDRDRWRM